MFTAINNEPCPEEVDPPDAAGFSSLVQPNFRNSEVDVGGDRESTEKDKESGKHMIRPNWEQDNI